jgi:hypothetical protein
VATGAGKPIETTRTRDLNETLIRIIRTACKCPGLVGGDESPGNNDVFRGAQASFTGDGGVVGSVVGAPEHISFSSNTHVA